MTKDHVIDQAFSKRDCESGLVEVRISSPEYKLNSERVFEVQYLVSGLAEPERGLRGEVGGHERVCGAPLDLVVLGCADDDGVRDDGDELVDVRAHVDLDHVAVLQHHVGVVEQRREVADAVVHADAGGERDA